MIANLMATQSSAALNALLGAASPGGAAAAASGSAAAQDLQSFMSALIQELRQSGAAASTVATGNGSGSVSGLTGTGAHHGARHLSNQLESMLQQLQDNAAAHVTGASAVAAIADSKAPGGAGLQASFRRLMQDLQSTGAGRVFRASA